MPRSEKSSRAVTTVSFSWRRPTAAKTGVPCAPLTVGLAVCAARQIEQEAASVLLGWLWVDSAAAVHSIRDRQSHTDQRTQKRFIFR